MQEEVAAVVAAAEARLMYIISIESKNMHEYFRGEGSTYTIWRQFGANKSVVSSECPNIWVPMFGHQTEFYLCLR